MNINPVKAIVTRILDAFNFFNKASFTLKSGVAFVSLNLPFFPPFLKNRFGLSIKPTVQEDQRR
jgi:hypothetical protein